MHLHLLFKYELEISPSLTPKQLSYTGKRGFLGHAGLKIDHRPFRSGTRTASQGKKNT